MCSVCLADTVLVYIQSVFKTWFSDILFVSAVHLFTPKPIPLNPGQPCYNLLISYRARAAASISASVLKEEKLKRTIPCFSV